MYMYVFVYMYIHIYHRELMARAEAFAPKVQRVLTSLGSMRNFDDAKAALSEGRMLEKVCAFGACACRGYCHCVTLHRSTTLCNTLQHTLHTATICVCAEEERESEKERERDAHTHTRMHACARAHTHTHTHTHTSKSFI